MTPKPATEPVVRDANGRITKGALNPGGRSPKWLKEVRAELKRGSKVAARYLAEVVEDPAREDKDRIAAAKELLRFTVPPPKQTVKIDDGVSDALKGIPPSVLERWAQEEAGADGPGDTSGAQ